MEKCVQLRNAVAGLLIAVLGTPVAGSAQGAAREFHADARPVSLTVGLAWRVSPGWYAGVTLGAGIDELGKTFRPSDRTEFHTLEQIIHVGGFVRRKVSDRIDLDVGTRTGFGSVRSCDASDC